MVTDRLSQLGEVEWKGDSGPPAVWVLRNGKVEGMPTDKAQWPKLRKWTARVLAELWSLFGTPDDSES